MDYKNFRNWLEGQKNNIVLGGCFVLVFIIGFGSGRYIKEKDTQIQRAQNNYTKKTVASQTQIAVPPVPEIIQNATSSTEMKGQASCYIKGNISSGGRKIYHVPEGRYYKMVKPEQCFTTEGEALAAGYVKSSQ